MSLSLVAGTGGPLILQVYQYAGGPLVNLDSTPTITISCLDNGAVVVPTTTSGVTHPATGTYLYQWSAAVSGGNYLAVWNGALSGTAYQASELINVYVPATGTVGPCSWAIDTGCDPNWATYSQPIKDSATAYATTVLWAATGRRFGLCARTVRPCGKECSGDNGYFNGGWYWSEGSWLPYIWQGEWRNCWCGCAGALGCCGCRVDCQVYLPGPVNSIISVFVDGTAVDPSTYRVDNGQWLVRTVATQSDVNPCWPLFQNFNVGPSATGSFVVSYLQGLAVPADLQRAAGELASEYAKACLGQACRLPQRATSIARQGVTVSLVDVDTLLNKGLTGLFTVDQVIRTYNPSGLTRPLRIVSPDATPIRTQTWP